MQVSETRILEGQIVADEAEDTINVISLADGASLSAILWGMDTVGQSKVRVTVEVLDA